MCGTCSCNSNSRDVKNKNQEIENQRTIGVRKKILSKNDAHANELRQKFFLHDVFAINMMSSPGSGKTELLTWTLGELNKKYRPVAITGDLATENDASRLITSGAPAKQIVTGTLCHLEADLVSAAIDEWDVESYDFLFIENIGNLVCPGSFDLGEDLRVVLIATTEGEDKPLKYPTLVNTADVVLITKMDIAGVLECDVELLERNVREVCPEVPIIRLSAKNGDGLADWAQFLLGKFDIKRSYRYGERKSSINQCS